MTLPKLALLSCLTGFALHGSGWDRGKAFEYLEARQQQWADWKPAQKPGGPCLSCHTGLSYLMARRVLGQTQPRPLEAGLAKGVRSRVLANPPQTMLTDPGAEAILNLLTLALQRRNRQDPMDAAEQAAMKRLWENQIAKGEEQGTWSWFQNDLHPVESEHSAFFAAALADRAVSAYRPDASPAGGVSLLRGYMKREAARQPLHNRLAWIAFGSEVDKESKSAALRDLWAAQSSDGGFSHRALGPWSARPDAPADAASSNAYATGWAAFTARQSGVSCSDSKLRKAMSWLEEHQDHATGAWTAGSMNKVYPEGSMQSKFMSDAATGYALAALLSCDAGQ